MPSGFGAKTSVTMDPAQVTRVVPVGLSDAVRMMRGVRHFVKRKGPRTFVHIYEKTVSVCWDMHGAESSWTGSPSSKRGLPAIRDLERTLILLGIS